MGKGPAERAYRGIGAMKDSEFTPLARLAAAVKEQVEGCAGERAALRTCAENLREGLEALLGELQSADAEGVKRSEATEGQLGHLREAVAETERIADELRRKLRSAEDELSKHRTSSEKASERIAHLEKVLAENSDAAQVARNRIEDLSRELEQRNKALRELPALEEKISTLERELQKQRAEAAKAVKEQERVAHLEQQLREKAELADAAEAARRHITELERSLEIEAEWESKAAQLQSELDVARQDFAADQERFEAEIAQARANVEAERERVREQEAAIAKEKSSATAALERVTALDKTLREERKALASLEAEVKRLREGDASEALEDARLQVATLEAELASTQEMVAQMQARADGGAGAAVGDDGRWRAQVEAMEKALEEEQAGKRFLSDELEQALAERDESRKELLVLRKKVKSKNGDEPVEKLRRAKKNGAGDAKRQRMGDILVEAGVITAEELQLALQEQKKSPSTRLGNVLVALDFATEEEIAQALGLQRNIEFARLDAEALDSRALKTISGRLAEQHMCVPVRIMEDALTLAMVNPLDLIAIEDVERASGLRVEPVVATHTDIVNCIHVRYHNVVG